MAGMVNERLRRAILRAGHGPDSLAAALQVSSKSVVRWLAGTSVPYPKTRYRIAALVGEDESYLWPEVADRRTLAGAELVATWPRRTDVPKHLWTDLLRQAERSVDVLAFAGLFLPEEHPEWLPTLRAKAEADVRVRLVLGDPDGRQLADVAQIRLHDTPLYNSIYRFDDELLVNLHVYGLLAAYTPCLHIRRIDGQFFNTYLESFERVWASARPLDRERTRGR